MANSYNWWRSSRSPIIIQNSSNPSSRKKLDVPPYDRTTVRPTVQGATFSMRGQLYRGHANARALSSSPVVSALGSETDDLGSSPGRGKALCAWDVRGEKCELRFQARLNLYITKLKVWKLKDIHYNHQTLCILAKKESITTIISPKCSCLLEIINFCHYVVLYLQYFYQHEYMILKLSHGTWLYRSCGGSCVWGLTFQLPQQTVVIRITSQGVFTKCSSFQISHLIITADFTPFGGCLQLDHPVTCENIRCYSHIQIITWWTGKSSMCFSCFCHSKYYRSIRLPLNPSIPESDQHLISPYYITSESYIEVMRIKEMITNYRSSRLSNKFSLIAPDSMENTHNDVRV